MLKEDIYLEGRMLTGSSASKDTVKKRRERIKRRRRKNMMELPKHKLKSKSNTSKDLKHKDTAKAIDVSSVNDPIVITVKDYDKKSVHPVLESKEQKVGVVVLVNGKPAIIMKRRKYTKQNKKLQTHREVC